MTIQTGLELLANFRQIKTRQRTSSRYVVGMQGRSLQPRAEHRRSSTATRYNLRSREDRRLVHGSTEIEQVEAAMHGPRMRQPLTGH